MGGVSLIQFLASAQDFGTVLLIEKEEGVIQKAVINREALGLEMHSPHLIDTCNSVFDL